jgi:hypothetical protein
MPDVRDGTGLLRPSHMMTAVRLTPFLFLLFFFTTCAVSCNGGSHNDSAPQRFVHFVPNSHAFWSDPGNWTTAFGPAYANILLASTNFLPCRGGPYALCYYSGPSSGTEDLSCTLTADGLYANCKCFTIPYGVYFVDINAILNHAVYEKTVAQCGADGSLCQTLNAAPVCQSVNQGTLIPNAQLFSTFSFDCVPTNGLGQTACAQAPYAGCMTAPCVKTDQPGIARCSCPVFDGPYQVGQNDQVCSLGGDLVWSAAYAPPSMTMAPTIKAPPPATPLDELALIISADPHQPPPAYAIPASGAPVVMSRAKVVLASSVSAPMTASSPLIASAAEPLSAGRAQTTGMWHASSLPAPATASKFRAAVLPATASSGSTRSAVPARRTGTLLASSVPSDGGPPPIVPDPPTCLPDAPGGVGCPLYVSGTTMLPPDSGADCAKVCDEYDSCRPSRGIQVGYTCDATLCTDQCNDRDLVGTACSGLSTCDISEIVKAETAASCSCCASQLCGCNSNGKTGKAIYTLNQDQRDRMISPQCDINGTLCGSP